MNRVDTSLIDQVKLTPEGIEKLWEKVHYSIINSPFVQTDVDQDKMDALDTHYAEFKKLLLINWYRVSNGYEILPHAILPGLVATLVQQTDNDIFMGEERFIKTFIPWTDIEEIILAVE